MSEHMLADDLPRRTRLLRLAEHIRTQNWTAIAIDFCIVVIGVFVGIQVANWNQTRQEHARESGFLSRLHEDFEAIDARLTDNGVRWQRNLDAANRLLADVDAFGVAGQWPREKAAMLDDLNVILSARTPAQRPATYDEMKADGQLGILQDARLRDALRVYDERATAVAQYHPILMARIDPFRPLVIGHLRFDRALTAESVIEMLDRKVTRGGYFVDVDLEALAAEPALRQALTVYAQNFLDLLVMTRIQQRVAQPVLLKLRESGTHDDGPSP